MTRNLIFLAVLLPFSVFCQSRNVPAFGRVDVADLKQTACSYDKGAEAEEIFNVGDFSLDVIGGRAYQTVHRHVRIKIYSEKGLEYADVKLPYANYHNDEVISNLVANTYNLDATGNVVATKLEKDLVYDRKIDIAHAQKIFTMPNVKVGSVIEYKYTVNKAYLINWYLQRQIPTRYTSFVVDVPSLFEMYLRPMCNMPYESNDKSTSQRTIKTFAMANVPALYQEDYMTCYDDYRQRIETWPIAMTIDGIRYPLLKSWTETTKDALTDESFGTQLKKSIPRTSDLDLALQPVADSFQRMAIIYDYVRKNMAWDGQQTMYASTGVKAAWKEKKGTSGEINLILINLLKDAGLRAYPVMVSTHDNGTVSTAFPDFKQFNNVMAMVKIKDKEYVLDGTDKYTPASLIPEGVMNTEGLVIDESNINNYYWTMLWDPNKLLNDVVAIQAVVKETGDMEGHASVRSQDYSRIDRAKMYLRAKDEYVSKYCVSAKDGIKLDNMEIEGVNQDTVPLVQKFDFHAPVNHSGDYSYFSANFFTGMEKNPFIADNRFSDVFFGTNQSHTIVAYIEIPEDYEFDALPKNTRITMEDKSLVVTRMVEAQNGVLSTRITLEYKRPFYTIEEYPVLKEFYKKMYSLLDEQFVIKKKSLILMMKKFAGVFCCLTVLVASTYSQYRHQFGAITAADVEMKQCPFDPEAGAVMLVNEGYSDYDDSHHLITLIHRRIKILSEKGMSNANVTIYYQSDDDYESVDNIEAVTINTDEHNQRTEYPVDRKSIFTKKKSQYFSESTFAFSNVKVGSFLEYRFRSTKRYGSALSNWNFQEHIPVCYSSFELHPAPTLEFTYQVQKSPKYPVVIKPSPLSNTTYFEMDSLPGLDDEPYMDARNDYIQRVNFTVTKFEGMAGAQRYMDDWNQVARQLWGEPYFGAEIKANLKEPHDMIAVAAGGKTDLEKMKLIYDFVRNNVEWNRVYSHVAFDGVRTAWNKKSGTSGSVNLLLVNLLRDAGLDVYPMLVSDRSNGHVNTKTPFVNQFNNVYALVKVDGKNYYLDATNRYTSVDLVPDDILNTTALVVKNKTGELLNISEPEKKYREVVYFSANLSEDGRLSSSVQTVSKDYAKQYRERRFNAGDKADYIEHVLKQGLANVAIDSLEVEGDKNDSSDFIQRFRVEANVSSTGDYSFLGLNMFSGFEKTPFVSNNRFSDVNFGYMQNINLVWLVKVPEKWTIDALPKSLKMVNQDRTVVFSREITYNKELSQINARIKIDLNKSLYGLDEYADLKEFFKKMTGLLDEQIVFKTK